VGAESWPKARALRQKLIAEMILPAIGIVTL
jgi:hypothetical protein